MATTEPRATSAGSLQETARRHLWLHFSRMGAYSDDAEIPIIVRGEGCYLWDEHGNRYFDGLSALFCSNIGHGRQEVGQAGADQAGELEFVTNWSYAHPQAITLAARIADLAPGDLNRVFFTSGGSEAVESAIKLSRQFHKLNGKPLKTKIIARDTAYHGTTLGALSATGITSLRQPFEPLTPGVSHVPNTNMYRYEGDDPMELAEAFARAHRVRGPRHGRRGDPRAGAERRRLLHAAGGLLRARARDLRRARRPAHLRRGHLLLGTARRVLRRAAPGYRPDLITTAKGITSAYAPMGALIASDRIAEPFMQGHESFLHGYTFAGHPCRCAIAHANLDVFENEGDPRPRPRERGRVRRRCSSRCATSRSSATRAAWATSARSSSSRTARRRRASTTTRASGCCAASSPASSTAAA